MKPEGHERSVGICLGATTLSLVELHKSASGEIRIARTLRKRHEGSPWKRIEEILAAYDPAEYFVCLTGRKYRRLIDLPSLIEPEATELAYAWLTGGERRHDAIVSAGGENFMVYELDRKGRISRISSGNKCASGTGEFFLQQIQRMNISLDEAVQLSHTSRHPHQLSGRCSVFCKSDCTHALNKGESIADITAGLARMIAEKIVELLLRIDCRRVLVVGGTTRNTAVIEYLRTMVDELSVPPHADCFEALGAALGALRNRSRRDPDRSIVNPGKLSSFVFLPPISDSADKVVFREQPRPELVPGDEYLLGLDVGSTTTKAVLIHHEDNRIVKSVYLRTDGNPVEAARKCYRGLADQLAGIEVCISALGVTGSGRYIAALHAGTDGIINEIIAHARAAASFDPTVDTIFEIGGQDAKYTYLTNQVAADYAMNEACSAGTGSFLEESAYETLNISTTEIAPIALRATRAPDFSDQCAAFIASDIHTALQEGIDRDMIVAGLVYSICRNYLNRVRGSRPTGKQVFMQGGVCYNRAVPMAMAALTDRRIIVPPDPGLMGAFGVALECRDLLHSGRLEKGSYDLEELSAREVRFGREFVCPGTPENCDRKCRISLIEVEGRRIPFGGACNKYYNNRYSTSAGDAPLNHVEARARLLSLHSSGGREQAGNGAPVIGINRSFHTHTLLLLYRTFFSELGCTVILPDRVREEAINRGMTSYCLSGKLALGYGADLIEKRPDYIFMPQIKEMHVSPAGDYRIEYQTTCMFLQGEPWYQNATNLLHVADPPKLIAPVLNFMRGYDAEESSFVTIARRLGFSAHEGRRAHRRAVEAQLGFIDSKKSEGRKILARLERDPDRFAVVLFGRPYNAFVGEANKGIPGKFASRGIDLIPFDFLMYQDEPNYRDTYWEMGQKIIKAARIVERHPQLYGCFVTNFLCAVDSMMITHFRDLMGTKPSLTIEVDTHTADAGINTRIEAFLDIIRNYRRIGGGQRLQSSQFRAARLRLGETGGITLIDSAGRQREISDDSVTVLVPSMGTCFAEGVAAALRGIGWNARALEECRPEVLKLGKQVTTSKECLPIINILGEVLHYARHIQQPGELAVVAMVGAGGCCRVGQYETFIDRTIAHEKLANVVQLVLSNDDGFAGLGVRFRLKVLKALYTADIVDDMRAALMVLAVDRECALRILEEEKERIFASISGESELPYFRQTARSVQRLRSIELREPLRPERFVGIVGEIFVRRDHFSLMGIPERLAENGFIVADAPVSEWLRYTDFLREIKMYDTRRTLAGRLEYLIGDIVHTWYERRIKALFARTGLYLPELLDVRRSLAHSTHFFPLEFTGEPGLCSGSALSHLLDKYCGVIAVGPFGCMNARMTEGVATREMSVAGKARAAANAGLKQDLEPYRQELDALPFLNLELDGTPLTQIDESRLEAFMLQAARVAGVRRRVDGARRGLQSRRSYRLRNTIAQSSFTNL